MDELKVIMQDIENVYHQLGAVLRDLDMILSDMDVDTDPPNEYTTDDNGFRYKWNEDEGFYILCDDPSNVDTDPPDEYNVFENEEGHDCKATVDGG